MTTAHRELHLAAAPKAAPELRHWLRDHAFDVRLCATELLTNVMDHVGEGAPVTVRVIPTAPPGHTRMEVTDPGPGTSPVLRSATSAEESGRGLLLLDALVQSAFFCPALRIWSTSRVTSAPIEPGSVTVSPGEYGRWCSYRSPLGSVSTCTRWCSRSTMT